MATSYLNIVCSEKYNQCKRIRFANGVSRHYTKTVRRNVQHVLRANETGYKHIVQDERCRSEVNQFERDLLIAKFKVKVRNLKPTIIVAMRGQTYKRKYIQNKQRAPNSVGFTHDPGPVLGVHQQQRQSSGSKAHVSRMASRDPRLRLRGNSQVFDTRQQQQQPYDAVCGRTKKKK